LMEPVLFVFNYLIYKNYFHITDAGIAFA